MTNCHKAGTEALYDKLSQSMKEVRKSKMKNTWNKKMVLMMAFTASISMAACTGGKDLPVTQDPLQMTEESAIFTLITTHLLNISHRLLGITTQTVRLI